MNHAEHRLIAICDDLLKCVVIAGPLGPCAPPIPAPPIPAPEAQALIDRILDIRNAIKQASQPQTNPKQQQP